MDTQLRIFAILLVSTAVCSAAEVTENSSLPDNEILSSQFSFQYRFTKRKAIEYDDVWHVQEAKDGMLSIDEISASISSSLHEALYLELILGKASWKTYDFAHETYNYDFDYSWLYGIGLRQYVLWTLDEYEMYLLLSFEYTTTSKQKEDNLQGELKQWNISGLWLIPLGTWTLSAGIYYSDFDMTYWHPSSLGRRRGGFEAEDNIGVLFGTRYFFTKDACLWWTIHLLSQSSITVGINGSF